MNDIKMITVTSPLLPDLKEFEKFLEDIWNRKWLTNNGEYSFHIYFSMSQNLYI